MSEEASLLASQVPFVVAGHDPVHQVGVVVEHGDGVVQLAADVENGGVLVELQVPGPGPGPQLVAAQVGDLALLYPGQTGQLQVSDDTSFPMS